jgi:hypothetical protein
MARHEFSTHGGQVVEFLGLVANRLFELFDTNAIELFVEFLDLNLCF